jgi:hypothetical protein
MAQIHIHNSEQREPQKSGIRGRRRSPNAVTTCDVEAVGVLPCVIHSAVERASSEPNLHRGSWPLEACPKPRFASGVSLLHRKFSSQSNDLRHISTSGD